MGRELEKLREEKREAQKIVEEGAKDEKRKQQRQIDDLKDEQNRRVASIQRKMREMELELEEKETVLGSLRKELGRREVRVKDMAFQAADNDEEIRKIKGDFEKIVKAYENSSKKARNLLKVVLPEMEKQMEEKSMEVSVMKEMVKSSNSVIRAKEIEFKRLKLRVRNLENDNRNLVDLVENKTPKKWIQNPTEMLQSGMNEAQNQQSQNAKFNNENFWKQKNKKALPFFEGNGHLSLNSHFKKGNLPMLMPKSVSKSKEKSDRWESPSRIKEEKKKGIDLNLRNVRSATRMKATEILEEEKRKMREEKGHMTFKMQDKEEISMLPWLQTEFGTEKAKIKEENGIETQNGSKKEESKEELGRNEGRRKSGSEFTLEERRIQSNRKSFESHIVPRDNSRETQIRKIQENERLKDETKTRNVADFSRLSHQRGVPVQTPGPEENHKRENGENTAQKEGGFSYEPRVKERMLPGFAFYSLNRMENPFQGNRPSANGARQKEAVVRNPMMAQNGKIEREEIGESPENPVQNPKNSINEKTKTNFEPEEEELLD